MNETSQKFEDLEDLSWLTPPWLKYERSLIRQYSHLGCPLTLKLEVDRFLQSVSHAIFLELLLFPFGTHGKKIETTGLPFLRKFKFGRKLIFSSRLRCPNCSKTVCMTSSIFSERNTPQEIAPTTP